MFESAEDGPPLRCELIAVKPRLDFGFRFHAGFIVSVPLKQYGGSGRRWSVLTKVTPDDGESAPVYLGSTVVVPDGPEAPKAHLEIAGSFLLGEGRYRIEWLMLDRAGRACRKHWTAEAKLTRAERDVSPRIPPNAVWSLASPRWYSAGSAPDETRRFRFTVLVHAAPLFPRRTQMRGFDRELLLASVASLVERLPASSVRVVAFNLEQQKTLFAEDRFRPESLEQLSRSLDALQLGTVEYGVLKNKGGHLGLLSNLANEELTAKEPPDAVIFMGPAARFGDKFPRDALTRGGDITPQFFYLQHRPYFGRGQDLPDSIQSLIGRLNGKTFTIHTPGEFARAVNQLTSALGGVRGSIKTPPVAIRTD
jgi:hypothetical protein